MLCNAQLGIQSKRNTEHKYLSTVRELPASQISSMRNRISPEETLPSKGPVGHVLGQNRQERKKIPHHGSSEPRACLARRHRETRKNLHGQHQWARCPRTGQLSVATRRRSRDCSGERRTAAARRRSLLSETCRRNLFHRSQISQSQPLVRFGALQWHCRNERIGRSLLFLKT